MPLTSKEKIQLMKQAYSEGYKGSFTELFIANDPNPEQDPNLSMPEIQPENAPQSSPAAVEMGPDAMPPMLNNQNTIEQENAAPSQQLVQSYGSETAGNMPTGERVETTLENPGQYKDGVYKLDNNYADNYLKDYLKKEGGYKWDLEKMKSFNKK